MYPIDGIISLGGFPISLLTFVPDGICAQRYRIGFNQLALFVNSHCALLFLHNNFIYWTNILMHKAGMDFVEVKGYRNNG